MQVNKITKSMKLAILGACGISILSLSGCAAVSTEIQHGSLQTSTKMSSTIFLPPDATNTKLIYVQVKNTSDQNVDITNQLVTDLQAKGYTITTSPDKAYQIAQVNILQAGKSDMNSINSALSDGFGGAVAGAAIGGAVGESWESGAIGGVIGGIGGAIMDAAITDVTYSMITDVQVSVRLPKGVTANQVVNSNMKEGTGTMVSSSYGSSTNMQQYQTRIVSYADKVNLKFPEAAPTLEANLAKEIAGIF